MGPSGASGPIHGGQGGKAGATHHHAPKQAAVLLAFHQQATNQVGGDQLGGAGEEGLGESWEGVVAMGVAWGLDWLGFCG